MQDKKKVFQICLGGDKVHDWNFVSTDDKLEIQVSVDF